MSSMMCVDPGLANVGLVVIQLGIGIEDGQRIVAAHHFSTERIDRKTRWRYADDKARRVQELARFYARIIKEHDIKRAAVELPTGGAPNSQAATDLAYASAAIVGVMAVLDVVAEWYDPREVKKAATGSVSASKDQMMAAICERWPSVLEGFPARGRREHVCDALGVWLAAEQGTLARL